MRINEAILHIMDNDTSSIVYSQQKLDLSEITIYDYIKKITERLFSGDVKSGLFTEENAIQRLLKDETLDFVTLSEKLTEPLFQITIQQEDLPGGDFLCVRCTDDQENVFVGLLKLNHKNNFTHFLDYEEDKIVNRIIVNKAILPAATQKIDEAFMMNLATGKYYISERKHLIDGDKRLYFSELYLKVQPESSLKESASVVKKVVKEVAKKYQNEDDFEIAAVTKQAIHDSIEDQGTIDVAQIGETIFENNHVAKQEYHDKMAEKELKVSQVEDTSRFQKRYTKQKFKLDNGIEIVVPVELYDNQDIIEFINNPDGTLSVMIKNIEKIKNQF